MLRVQVGVLARVVDCLLHSRALGHVDPVMRLRATARLAFKAL